MNSIAYFEIQSSNLEREARFYKNVFGWNIQNECYKSPRTLCLRERLLRAFMQAGLEKAKENLYACLMKEKTLSAGLSAEKTAAVDSSNTAASFGSGLLDVFATPAMIALMEHAAAEAVSPALEEGFSTVGAEISVKHLAATPPGMTVRARAVLTAVDGKKLVFDIEAFDGAGKIGEGTHTRYIIDNKKFLARVEEKLRQH
jgi:predicted thioesterase